MKDLLHQHGLKNTPLRIALLTLLGKVHTPLTAEEITSRLKKVDYDRATLFRCLKDLARKGIINVVDLGEGKLRYEKNCETHHHHHHIICQSCKKIEIVPVCVPESVIKQLQKKGYREITHRIDFTGTCKDCA